jgi:glycosyltransferase involved in cell wall biosynthesis
MMRVCYFGTFERDYPRNSILLQGLQAAGVEVVECHEPLWEKTRDKTGGYTAMPSLLRLSLSLGASYLRLIAKHRHLPPHQVCLVGYIGQPDLLLARLLHFGQRCAIIFVPMISLYDTIVHDRTLFSSRSLLARLLFWLDLLSFRLTDLLVADTQEEKEFFCTRFGLDEKKVVILPVGAEDTIFRPAVSLPHAREAPEPARQKKEPFEVLFYGKFIPLHGISYILDAAKLLEEENLHFTLIGIGQLRPEMEEKARRLNLKNVDFSNWVLLEELPHTIAQANVSLGIFDPGEKAGRVIPNKVYQALAMGKPVITGDSPAARSLLEGAALLCQRGSGEALAAAIRRMKNDPCLQEELSQKGYERFCQRFSSERIGVELKEIIQRLRSARPA